MVDAFTIINAISSCMIIVFLSVVIMDIWPEDSQMFRAGRVIVLGVITGTAFDGFTSLYVIATGYPLEVFGLVCFPDGELESVQNISAACFCAWVVKLVRQAKRARERSEVQEILMPSELAADVAKLQQILRRLPDIVVVCNWEFEIEYVSGHACKFLDYYEHEMLGKSLHNFMEDPEGHKARAEAFRDGPVNQTRTDVVYKGKRINLIILKVKSGSESFLIGAGREILEVEAA